MPHNKPKKEENPNHPQSMTPNENIHFEHGNFQGKCDREECPYPVTHRAFDDYSPDAVALKSLCDAHYKKGTQKKWIKSLRKKVIL